jgi:hypothetical protein
MRHERDDHDRREERVGEDLANAGEHATPSQRGRNRAPRPHADEPLAILNGLVFARASGAPIDVEPIVRLAEKLVD